MVSAANHRDSETEYGTLPSNCTWSRPCPAPRRRRICGYLQLRDRDEQDRQHDDASISATGAHPACGDRTHAWASAPNRRGGGTEPRRRGRDAETATSISASKRAETARRMTEAAGGCVAVAGQPEHIGIIADRTSSSIRERS